MMSLKKNDAMNKAAISVPKNAPLKKEYGVFEKTAGLENLKAWPHLQIISLG